MKRYLCSVLVSTFGLLLQLVLPVITVTSIFVFKTCSKEELLNMQLMQMNYIPKHSRDHADSEYIYIYIYHIWGRP